MALALWSNYAIPGLLYGAEVQPTNKTAIQIVDTQQNILGKAILQVPCSSATEIVNLDLGLKPIQMIIDERRLRYFEKITNPGYQGSNLVTECMNIQQINPAQYYFYSEIKKIKEKIKNQPGESSLNKLHSYYVEQMKNEVRRKQSLAGLPFPKVWWKKQGYVNESQTSSVIAQFRAGNAKLGNRDAEMSCYGPSNEFGQVKVCQLCHNVTITKST